MSDDDWHARKKEIENDARIAPYTPSTYPGSVPWVGWDSDDVPPDDDVSDEELKRRILAQKTRPHPMTTMRRPLPSKSQPKPPPRRAPARQAMHPVFEDDIEANEREMSKAQLYTQTWSRTAFVCSCNKSGEPPYLCNHLASYFYDCRDVAVGLMINDLEGMGNPFFLIRLPITYNLELVCNASLTRGLNMPEQDGKPTSALCIKENRAGAHAEVLLEKWDTVSRFIRVFVDACKSTQAYSECLDKLQRRKRMPCLAPSHNELSDKLLVRRVFEVAEYRAEVKSYEKTWNVELLRPTFEEIALEQTYSLFVNKSCMECQIRNRVKMSVPADLIPDV